MIDIEEFTAMLKELDEITNQIIELNHRLVTLGVRMYNFFELEKEKKR